MECPNAQSLETPGPHPVHTGTTPKKVLLYPSHRLTPGLMSYGVFIGALLVSFGPVFVEIWGILWGRPSNTIIAILSSSFWLVSLALSSFVSLGRPNDYFAFLLIIPTSVLFQEAMRYAFYRVYIFTQRKLQDATYELQHSTSVDDPDRMRPTQPPDSTLQTHPDSSSTSSVDVTRPLSQGSGAQMAVAPQPIEISVDVSLAIGLGFGVAHTLVVYSAVLFESWGPGTVFAPGCPGLSFFFVQAVWALAIQQMHVFINVVAFDAYKRRWWPGIVFVWLWHAAASSLSLLNLPGGSCVGSLAAAVGVIVGSGAAAFFSVFSKTKLLGRGGSRRA